MDASIWVSDITFKNGFKIQLKKNAIVVLVGPNNSGKSATLSDILSHLRSDGTFAEKVVENLVVKKEGSFEDLKKQLINRKKGNQYFFPTHGPAHALNEDQLDGLWQKFPAPKGQLSNYFVKYLSTQERLGLVEPAQNQNFLDTLPTHPIHFLKEDEKLEGNFEKYFKQAFGQDVIINHSAGSIIPLHVGKRPITSMDKHLISKEYQLELRDQPLLNLQGDGMKSFSGVFLSLFVQDYSINLIDEPEAFLHPPQAKLLGQMIAKNLGNDKQIFIATHSEHVLKGLLDYAGDRLTIIRIQREANKNHISLLENKEINNIWKDSLLRHSNILDGLFHKQVIVCESDSDCRFFSAILTELNESEGRTSPDILFIQSGGKHRVPVVVNALRKLEVPIKIICDIDLLNSENPLRKVFESMGGDWSRIERDFKIFNNAIDQKRPELLTDDLKKAMDQLFKDHTTKVMTQGSLKSIKELLRKASPWDELKVSGKFYVPPGDATLAFNNLISACEEKNIIILEIGEIEAFDKTIGGHGPRWVNDVLSKSVITSPDLEIARAFVRAKLQPKTES